MSRKLVLAMTLMIAMIGMLGITSRVQMAEATETVTIKADGSVDPPSAPIEKVGNVYTLKWNIYDSLVVEKSDIVVEGDGYALQGPGGGIGIDLTNVSNVTIKNIEIKAFQFGIWLNRPYQVSNNKFFGNTITNNTYGVWVFASNNTLSRNTIANNTDTGVVIDLDSSNNIITGNRMMNNTRGIWIIAASNNTICHNDFIDNTQQVHIPMPGHSNFWDDGYPSGGNYWSDYTGVDSDHDGIGDSWHEIDESNIDHDPLMGTFSDFSATLEHHVQTICNSTITDFQFNGSAISFNVTGEDGTVGFCRTCIPTALMNATYRVFVNGTEVPYDLLPFSNSTHSYLYFTYPHSTQEIIIVPEFPSFLILPLFMIVTLLAVIVYRRKHSMYLC